MRKVKVELTPAQAEAVLTALGNVFNGDESDQKAVFGSLKSALAAETASHKIRTALYGSKKRKDA